MCTTGAKILRPGLEFVLLKNRDFKRAHFDDRLSLTATAFGVLGLETWDGDDPANDRFSGFSLGFNATLACCDANVKTVDGGDNYDRLVQAVVEGATTVDEAASLVRQMVEDGVYCWANLLVATADEVAAIEVRDGRIAVARRTDYIARANHHVSFGANRNDDDTTTTPVRYNLMDTLLGEAQTLDDVLAITRTHAPGLDYGICNHGEMQTVYSYVVHWNEGVTTFYAHQGNPCDGVEFARIPITFGAPADFIAYPSNRALQMDSR
jgi:hypothetical protein